MIDVRHFYLILLYLLSGPIQSNRTQFLKAVVRSYQDQWQFSDTNFGVKLHLFYTACSLLEGLIFAGEHDIVAFIMRKPYFSTKSILVENIA